MTVGPEIYHEGIWGLSYEGWIALCTFILMCATIALGVFTYFLWRATKRAVEESIKSGKSVELTVAESARAATAMEAVAQHMQLSATAARDSVTALRERTAQQMRAYITVLIGNGLYQERKNGIRFEVRAPMLNTGHTPAHKVRYVARAAVLPVPLPFGFDFTLNEPATGAATLNAQQQFVLTRVVDDFVNDGDVERIKYAHLHAVYFWGRIEYEDVFGETHFTQFAHFLRWNPDGTIVGHYCEGHNNAS